MASDMKTMRITHAHLHNLKDISLEIPRQQLVAIIAGPYLYA